MKRRTILRLVIIYLVWAIIWYFTFEFIIKNFITSRILLICFFVIVLGLLYKDYYDIKNKKFPYPFPDYFDHAPFSVILALYYLPINPLLSFLAGLDAVLDFIDDLSKLK